MQRMRRWPAEGLCVHYLARTSTDGVTTTTQRERARYDTMHHLATSKVLCLCALFYLVTISSVFPFVVWLTIASSLPTARPINTPLYRSNSVLHLLTLLLR